MIESNFPKWLEWAREMQALSQTGLTYSKDEYDTQRYKRFTEIAAEIVQCHSDLQKDVLVNNFLAHLGYATPKIDVRGAVIRDGKILLVQERTDEKWCMPGGWADVGEIPSEMVEREVWEESGFKVKTKKVIAVYDTNRDGRQLEFFHAYKIIFLCEIIDGYARISNETMGVDFFDFDNLPPLSTSRTNTQHLTEILAHLMDFNRPAAFD